jgi:hypothetical protein
VCLQVPREIIVEMMNKSNGTSQSPPPPPTPTQAKKIYISKESPQRSKNLFCFLKKNLMNQQQTLKTHHHNFKKQ